MTRPLMQQKIGQLEALFARSKSDVKVLKQLEHELQYRQVPKAIALLGEVHAALDDAIPVKPYTAGNPDLSSPSPRPRTSSSQQPELRKWPVTATPLAVLPRAPTSPVEPQRPIEKGLAPPLPPELTMPVDEAYKLLKATTGSTWDSIELSRRHSVQQSHPSRVATLSTEKRARVQAEAKQVNAAYAVLWRARTGTTD